MNVIKANKSNKGLYIVVLFLIVSLILNGILFKNIKIQENQNEQMKNKQLDLEEKDVTILSLKGKITELENKINNNANENEEQSSNTKIRTQQSYLNRANEFITAYLNYDMKTLNERRKKLINITSDKLINQLAPEETENVEGQLSSDPTFSSKVLKSNLYISDIKNEDEVEDNKCEVIADIGYVATSSQGESKVRAFVVLELEAMEDEIKIIDYNYYPIN